jgi:hypothetical protein
MVVSPLKDDPATRSFLPSLVAACHRQREGEKRENARVEF